VIPGTRTYPLTLDPSSTWPRSGLDPLPVNKEERLTWHRAQSLFTVSSSTSPWCPGMAGHSQGTSLQPPPQGSTKLHLKGTLGVPASSYPIKGQAGALQGGRQRTTSNRQRKTSLHPAIEDQHLKQSPLYSHFFSETWARFPLSQLVTPTQVVRCKEIQYFPSPLDVGPSFVRTRINLRVLSLHHHPD
jgi:hypothetical protein